MPPSSRIAREQCELYALRAVVVAILKTLKGGDLPLAPIIAESNIGRIWSDDITLATEHVQEAIAQILDDARLTK